MTDRLTAETARVGIADVPAYVPFKTRFSKDAAPSLRAILSERAPDLLAALVEWQQTRAPWWAFGSPSNLALYDAIERARLLADPEQPAPLPAMWCGADAFTQENDDGR